MRVGLAVLACTLFVLAGCSAGSIGGINTTETTEPAATPVAGAKLTGAVHGGQQPITGAHVYLLAANTTGYGGNGIAASSSNASLSLLTAGTGRTLDTTGGPTSGDYYATTDASGNFSISGDYTCTAGQQVYLYALGGNPGLTAGTNNSASGLLAALGNCPSAGNFATATPYIVINEVSTIATAYAFAGFATDAVHVSSSGTALAKVGITNAFANATNLETLSTGAALATTPAGNGTVPQTEIDTLANILSACVNTNGAATGPTSPTPCYTLLTSTLSAGTTGTQPTDTATAAINIAHNPASNLPALYALSTATPPFSPVLTAQPNDFSVGINITGGGIAYSYSLAVDGAGDVWITNNSSTHPGVTELSSSGTFLSGAYGYTASGIVSPVAIAVDGSGDVWVGDDETLTAPSNVVELSSSGAVLSGANGYTSGGIFDPVSIAIGGLGNVWMANSGGDSAIKLSSSGSVLSGASGYYVDGIFSPTAIALDGSGNAWIGDSGGEYVTELSSSGSILSGPRGYATGARNDQSVTYAIALDGSGNAWVANYVLSFLTELSNAGVSEISDLGATLYEPIAIDGGGNAWLTNKLTNSVTGVSGSGLLLSGPGYRGGGISTPYSIAVDGSGNIWTANLFGFSVSELIGAAVPVITPICAGLPATPTVDGSSKLGTRP
jgi:hypothetical protein